MNYDLMTLEEVAEYCNVSIHTVRSWRKRRLIRVIKLPGGSVRMKRADLVQMIEERTEGRPEAALP